jgi:hypothetical protein
MSSDHKSPAARSAPPAPFEKAGPAVFCAERRLPRPGTRRAAFACLPAFGPRRRTTKGAAARRTRIKGGKRRRQAGSVGHCLSGSRVLHPSSSAAGRQRHRAAGGARIESKPRESSSPRLLSRKARMETGWVRGVERGPPPWAGRGESIRLIVPVGPRRRGTAGVGDAVSR